MRHINAQSLCCFGQSHKEETLNNNEQLWLIESMSK